MGTRVGHRVARVRAHAEHGSAGAWAAPHLERRLLLVDLRDDGLEAVLSVLVHGKAERGGSAFRRRRHERCKPIGSDEMRQFQKL